MPESQSNKLIKWLEFQIENSDHTKNAIAKSIDLASPSLYRMFSSGDMKLSTFLSITDVMGIDVIKMLHGNNVVTFEPEKHKPNADTYLTASSDCQEVYKDLTEAQKRIIQLLEENQKLKARLSQGKFN